MGFYRMTTLFVRANLSQGGAALVPKLQLFVISSGSPCTEPGPYGLQVCLSFQGLPLYRTRGTGSHFSWTTCHPKSEADFWIAGNTKISSCFSWRLLIYVMKSGHLPACLWTKRSSSWDHREARVSGSASSEYWGWMLSCPAPFYMITITSLFYSEYLRNISNT